MSTVSTSTSVSTPATPASPPPPPTSESGLPAYFAQASTRWDLVKFLAPFVLIFVWFLIQLRFDVIGLKEEVVSLRATCVGFQTAKEERGDRMARLEVKMDAHDKALDELKDGQKGMIDRLDRILERSNPH